MKVEEEKCLFSFVIPTRNDFAEFKLTIKSLCSEAPERSEIIIVDGYDMPLKYENILKLIERRDFLVKYYRDEKKGVFPAINLGLRACSGKWIILLGAGDILVDGAGYLLANMKDCDYDIIVFSERAVDKYNKLTWTMFPNDNSV